MMRPVNVWMKILVSYRPSAYLRTWLVLTSKVSANTALKQRSGSAPKAVMLSLARIKREKGVW